MQAVKEVLLLHGARRLGAAKAKADEMSLLYNEFAGEPSYLVRSAPACACSGAECPAMPQLWLACLVAPSA